MAETTISLPFNIDPLGSVAHTEDQSKIWADRVRSVLGTMLRERVMRPTFGTLIPYAIFETSDDAVTEIKTEVNKAFASQLPLLSLSEVDVTIDEFTNVATIDVIYNLPNTQEATTTIGLILVQGNKPAYQEIS